MKELLLSHYSGLCATGGNQPYLALQECFRQEVVGGPTLIEPGSLDAPLFSPAGSHIGPDLSYNTMPVQSLVILEGRL